MRHRPAVFGAEGIGLTRTEHMFFGGRKIDAMRRMILAETTAEREKALKALLPLQRRDFEGIFKAMDERPVTIRTLDPPLHEFLPHEAKDQRELAKQLGVSGQAIAAKVESPGGAQPDAGPPRLPPGHHLPGDHPHAGPGDLRGGAQRLRPRRRARSRARRS